MTRMLALGAALAEARRSKNWATMDELRQIAPGWIPEEE